MAPIEKSTTVLSTKGQVILPKPIRERRHWDAGMRLIVEDTADGVLLRPAEQFQRTEPTDVFASLPFVGKAKTLEEMKRGVLAEAKRRHDRD